MRPGEVLYVDGIVVSCNEVRRKLPVVPLRTLKKIHGRITVRHRVLGAYVIGRQRDGRLVLARFLPDDGWHQVPGGWSHVRHERPDPVSDDAHALHMWAASAPFIPWQTPPAIAGKNSSEHIKEQIQ